ncbi:hypothetical protein T261_8030 [Streptomyces lydicus]|nr:hypothetical protein T261_8030 [Streptomyces lydicus]
MPKRFGFPATVLGICEGRADAAWWPGVVGVPAEDTPTVTAPTTPADASAMAVRNLPLIAFHRCEP